MSEDKVIKTDKKPLVLNAGEVVRNKEFFSKVKVKMNRQLLGSFEDQGKVYKYNEVHEVEPKLADKLLAFHDASGPYFERV